MESTLKVQTNIIKVILSITRTDILKKKAFSDEEISIITYSNQQEFQF